jgi:ketosteroid isomerase-like protein
MVEINIPEVVTAVTAEFQRYEQALVSNDVETLDALFWPSEFTLRYGVAECLYGYEAIAQFRATRAAMDLRRNLMNTTITTYGNDVASANTEFRRIGAQMTGRQSHVWLRTEQGWKIAAAHVSLLKMPDAGAAPTAGIAANS